jgi:thiol-disulfide isomerase/thioredoxin
MSEAEEPQFTSLSARIAALNQQGVGKSIGSQSTPTAGKRPPPPPPPSGGNRPALPSRAQTTNNPPITTHGSATSKRANNLPIGTRGQELLPPPPVDRDQPRQPANGTPPLPTRSGPPPLPTRKASQPSPNLPPRKGSAQLGSNTTTQMVRRGSNSSIISYSSTISGMSLSQAGSATSASSVGSDRKLPPALGDAKLPPLPPTRRELEEKARVQKELEEREAATKVSLVAVKSHPALQARKTPIIEKDIPLPIPPRPKMPPRPSTRNSNDDLPPQPPRIPSRPRNEEEDSSQPARRLPPPGRSALSMGFGTKPSNPTKSVNNETPRPGPRPGPTYSRPAGPAVVELTTKDFDRMIRGKFAFVKFFGPKCSLCEYLAPDWKQLGEDFAFASDRLIIAKVNMTDNPVFHNRYGISRYPTLMFFDGDAENGELYEDEKELDSLTQYVERKTGIKASDAALAPKANGPPPIINLKSKPTMSEVRAVQSRPQVSGYSQAPGCLICRDFSGPDEVAARYPRHSLPQRDAAGYLADVLCGPFSSHTDKARAIFTWMHHNIAYDVGAFFGNRIKHVEPKDTIASGLAVCGGYAGAYESIALKAGLECVMVTGHGKGYGYSALKPNEPVPRSDPTGHAWNAVRIDGGEWKLIDPCWGAGNVGNQVYNKSFNASEFTKSNEDFGLKHFPGDNRYFYRKDGRIPTWEEYYLGPCGAEPLQIFGNGDEHGIAPTSYQPPQRHIQVNSDEIIRFQFHRMCEHWDFEKNGSGKPYPLILKIWGVDGRKEDFVAFENNDFWYWADVKARDLGAPGQTISVYSVTTINGKDARGVTRREYLSKKGRAGFSFGAVVAWELV